MTCNDNSESSYQESQCGPWGMRLNDQIANTADMNTPFDQLQWEDAKLNGCQPAPCKEYPTWPPPPVTGFIYPSMSKVTQDELLGEQLGPGMGSVPFIEQSKVPSALAVYKDRKYTPEEILNEDACTFPEPADVPRALPGSTYGPTPLDDMSYSLMNAQGGMGMPLHVAAIEGNWMIDNDNTGDRVAHSRFRPPPQPQQQQKREHMTISQQQPEQMNEHMTVTQSTPPQKGVYFADQHNAAVNNVGVVVDSGASLPEPPVVLPAKNGTDANQKPKNVPVVNRKPVVPNRIELLELDIDDNDDENDEEQCCDRYNLHRLYPCTIRALKGILYDLARWDDLPVESGKLAYIMQRGDRMFYLATVVLVILVAYALLRILAVQLNLPISVLNQAIGIAIIAFLIYFLTPQAEGDNQLIKGVAVGVIVLILVIFKNVCL